MFNDYPEREYAHKQTVGSGKGRQMNVVKYASGDIVWTSEESSEQFIRERHGVANHVNMSPNSLGRLDKHKINLIQRQLHPTMIGLFDLLQSSKDVGQSGMISPWADIAFINEFDKHKYPNIKFELFKFIQEEFPTPALQFNAKDIVEYDAILDKLVAESRIDLDYHIPKGGTKS